MWKYTRGVTICLTLFIIGILLQFCIGPLNLSQFKHPTNIILSIIYVGILFLLTYIGKKNSYIDWFSKFEAAFTSCGMFLIILIIMGTTRQETLTETIKNGSQCYQWDLGLHRMTTSWIFVLQFFYFMSILGMVSIKKLIHFKWKNLFFLLNHLGLFIALFSGVFGSSDIQRVRIQTKMLEPEWKGTNNKNETVKLPIKIELKQFKITQYPPKLFIISNNTWEIQSLNKQESILIDKLPKKFKFLEWKIEATKFLPMAKLKSTNHKENINFISFDSIGATSAIYIKAHNKTISKEGWISCGNYLSPPKILTLNQDYSIIMPELEPKQFSSLVNLYQKNKKTIKTTIKVNKPVSVAGWKIYQLSYDKSMGRWSNMSIFEVVKDPWLPCVYVGISMMLMGAVGLFLTANKKKKNDHME